MNKVSKIVNHIIPIAHKSTMTSRHSAAIFGNGFKILSSGYNHDRGCIHNKTVLSCHAEMDALLRLLNSYRLYSLRGFMTDDKNTTLARLNEDKNIQCLLREKGIY